MKANEGSSFAIKRPVAILMVFLAATVFGYLSLGRLAVTLMPELTYPTLTVRTVYPGAAPEEVENDIGRPIEEALGIVAGLSEISSINRAGISDVVLEFSWDTEMHDAAQDVLEKLDRVFLPDDAERPLILHYDPALDPVMELSLSGKGKRFEGESGLRRLRRLAELQIKRELEPIKGIAAVRVRGGLEEEIQVLLDEDALQRSGIAIQQVITRLAQENINVAGGTLKEGRVEYLVRTLNEYEDIGQIGDTIITSIDGRDVRIRDIGRVAMSHKEREILTRTDGGESVQLDVYKEADANIVALAERVRAALGEFDPEAEATEESAEPDREANLGETMSAGLTAQLFKEEGALIEIVADRSRFIESSINEVRNTALMGGLLAILVLYLFLRRVKSTAIIAVAIPLSLLVTFAPLNLLGVSLNIMSLGGLALGIGMLVDSSIVVLESIYRCQEEGDDVVQAAERGTSEVRAAVFASTLTSIAVFFPMVFVEGLAGQAFGDLGLAVVFSLLIAAAVALYFIPMLASRKFSARIGVRSGYVDTANWKRIRESFRGASRSGKIFGAPVYWLRAMAGFISYLYRTVAASIAAAYSRAWAEFGEDFKRSPGWVKILGSVPMLYWPLRVLFAIVMPYALCSVSWQSVRRDFARTPRWARFAFGILLVPYWTVRFVVGSALEGAGWTLLLALRLIITLLAAILAPVVAVVLFAIVAIPGAITQRLLRVLDRGYPRTVSWALAHPGVVVLFVVLCFWGTWQVATSLDSELLPEVHQGEFTVEVGLPVGTPLEETERVVSPVERAILSEKDNIRSLALTVGFDSANSQRSDEGEHTARFKVMLDDESRGAEQEQAVIARLRDKFSQVPDLEARIVRPVLFSSKTPIEVEIHGTDLPKIRRFSEEARDVIATLSEVADVETTMRAGAPEVQIVYDRDRLSRYGLNIGDVARLVRDKVKGFEATRFNMKDRRIPILVRLEMDDRETVEDVSNIVVNPGGDRPIPLSAVADVSLGEGPSEVRRIDGRRVALVQANLAEGSLSAAALAIERELQRQMEWPADMSFLISGQNEEWNRSRTSLYLALGLSLFLVYVIMAAQFESLVHPLVIMVTIPLAFLGTVVTLKALGMNLSIVVFLGMIMLAGIVVNNAIVLVDYINTLRKRDIPRDEAIVQAGAVRLRPILMTTATTVLGLTPLALGVGDGAEIRAPMAIAVISGLISSTVLTLLVIPTVYALMDKLVSGLLGSGARTRQRPAPMLDGGADSVMP